MNKTDREAWTTLHEYRLQLTRQQIRTLAGQIKSGQPDAAMNGLARILDRNADRNASKKVVPMTCLRCGAPLGESGKCSYCGTIHHVIADRKCVTESREDAEYEFLTDIFGRTYHIPADEEEKK